MTDFSYDLIGPYVPPAPSTGPTGWPLRNVRSDFGPTMKDERRAATPDQEINADQVNLMWWQAAGLGIVAPQAVFFYDPNNDESGVPRIRWGAFTWYQTILLNVADASFPSFIAITHNGVGDKTFTFAATVLGRDAALHTLTLRGAIASPCGTASFVPPNHRAEVTLTGNAVRVRTRTSAGVLVLTPFVVVVF